MTPNNPPNPQADARAGSGDYSELRSIADAVEAFGLRQSAARLRAIAEGTKEDERWCAMQEARGGQLRAIPWGLAELLYPAYGSHEQTLERLHERGGFGRGELGMLAVGMYGGTKQVTRGFERTFPLLDIYRAGR